MGLFDFLKDEEISYIFSLPDDECLLVVIRAHSSRHGEIARMISTWYVNDKVLHIGELYVEKNYRNRGIGDHMLKEVIRIAKELGAKEIWGNISIVDDVNRLYSFYTKRGFIVKEKDIAEGNFVATIHYEL